MRKENFIPHEIIIEELKEAIANIEEVERFSIIFAEKPEIDLGYYDLLQHNVTEQYCISQCYVINVTSKDEIKYKTHATAFGLELYVERKGLSKLCKYITDDIKYHFKERRIMLEHQKREEAINKALLNAYEDRDKIIEEDKRKENKDMNNEENRTLEVKSDDYIMGASCAAQAFSEVDKGRFRKSDEYDLILNSYYKGFEICKAYIKGNTNDENREAIEKIIKDMDELADFFDGFLNGYADATLYYYEQGKKEREEI